MANLSEYLSDFWSSTPRCKECNQEFSDRPSSPSSYSAIVTRNAGTQYVSKPKAVYDAELVTYYAELATWEAGVKEHLTTHPFGECKFCGHVVKRAGLRAHQKSFSCQENQRTQILEKQGYVSVEENYRELHNIFIQLKKKLLSGTEWDDGPGRRLIEKECIRAIETFEDLGNIHRCYTVYRPVRTGPTIREDECGWQLKAFAPTDTAIALKNCLKPYNLLSNNATTEEKWQKLLEAFYTMWNWLYMDEEQRNSAIGLWELASQRY